MARKNDEVGVPIRVLSSWLLQEVARSIGKNRQYVNPIITKNFQPTVMSVSFLLRIMQFISTTDAKDITALLSDTTHQILAIFKFDPAIVGFENKYHQRMTYNTVHRIIRVKKANLRFMTTKYINQNFKFKLDGSLEIAVLEILDFEIFLIDPYSFEKSIEYKLKYVYDEADYTALCGKKAEPDVLKYDDGLIESP